MSAFGGKADIDRFEAFCTPTCLRSLESDNGRRFESLALPLKKASVRFLEIKRAPSGKGGKRRADYTLELLPSKFPRHKPKADLALAERVLFEEMEHAAELLQSEDDFGRAGVVHALRTCHSFLLVRGLSGQALKPLIDLINALESVDKGVLPELFDPKIKRGQLPAKTWSRSPAAQETKLLAAACMDALVKGNLSKTAAAARVADFAVKWPRVSKGIITGRTVTNWRDELLQAPSKSAARRHFEGLSRMFSERPNSKSYLKEALRIGPVMTGGVRKRKTRNIESTGRFYVGHRRQ
jgi:hypothetical protein